MKKKPSALLAIRLKSFRQTGFGGPARKSKKTARRMAKWQKSVRR